MASYEGKKYKLDRQENFEEYMKAIGESFYRFFISGNFQLKESPKSNDRVKKRRGSHTLAEFLKN